MDSLDYEQLLEELNKIIIKKKKITWNQLKEWINSKNIGFLTLSLLLEDLKEKMGVKIKFSEKKILVDEILEIYVPDEIIYHEIDKINKEEKVIHSYPKLLSKKTREKRKEKKSTRPRKISKSSNISILDFLSVEKRIKESKEENKENKSLSSKQKEVEETDAEYAREITIKELADDKDTEIALSYLAKYWSVGEIRFIQDLKRLGVKDPKAVINKLLNKGYIERINIGIINAKEIIKKYKITTPLSEVFNA